MRLWGGEGVRVWREGCVWGTVWGVDVDVGLAGGAEGGERLWLWLGECLGSACEYLGCRWV